ncbi:hypothetical protein PHMEG_00021446 [Phytophthora megakarya]|uniref:Uncharacterized protein n=1 Tax=Phytophthora megakarya TaxID=4795 RepID=A0A225VL69_9STRA|nr:hypothetical protein PHMEG_00021446 [Phytophthora megakarya]
MLKVMRDELQRMEGSYVRGRKIDPRADHEVNVRFKNKHLNKRMHNISTKNYPKMPEVYLDERYCNVNPTTLLLVELGNGTASLELVSCSSSTTNYMGSIETWALHLKASDDTDYHGNFTGELFEAWFGDLYKNLLDTYGPCRIHMDGAAYHKVMVDPAPSSSKSKAKMVEWLHRHVVTVSIDGYKKKQLERLIAHAKPLTTYKTVVLAELYKHEVLYTPPLSPRNSAD